MAGAERRLTAENAEGAEEKSTEKIRIFHFLRIEAGQRE
jgi:hypothetical protein